MPFVGSDNLYEVKVTLTNVSAETLGDVRYSRLMDWDIEPTPFAELVTVRRGTTPALLFSNDNGFADNDPLRDFAATPIQPGAQNVDFTDSGPADHGAPFDFGFGALEPDQSTTFSIFYGAAGTTADADAAISASGAELYSYGKPNDLGLPNNALNTFIFGFRGLGGKPIIPPKLTHAEARGDADRHAPHGHADREGLRAGRRARSADRLRCRRRQQPGRQHGDDRRRRRGDVQLHRHGCRQGHDQGLPRRRRRRRVQLDGGHGPRPQRL